MDTEWGIYPDLVHVKRRALLIKTKCYQVIICFQQHLLRCSWKQSVKEMAFLCFWHPLF